MNHSPVFDIAALPLVKGPLGAAPPRRPNSIRRTTTIDVTWPGERTGGMAFDARGRDLLTGAALSDTHIARADSYAAKIGNDRTLLALEMTPARTPATPLVGCRGGGHLRLALKTALPDDTRNATPLYLLLDDISGVSLIAGWAWSRWIDLAAEMAAEGQRRGPAAGVCTGFTPGSSSLNPDGTNRFSNRSRPVPPLPRADDAIGWHALPDTAGQPSLRRSRRIDVWIDDLIRIDAMFQDSATEPAGGRSGLHEYHLAAAADPATGRLVAVEATPHILPYQECPAATLNLPRLLGRTLDELRDQIPVLLAKTDGCTHLNDALRALTSVPAMLATLTSRAA